MQIAEKCYAQNTFTNKDSDWEAEQDEHDADEGEEYRLQMEDEVEQDEEDGEESVGGVLLHKLLKALPHD